MTARARPSVFSLERLGLTALVYAPFRIFFTANLLSNASWFIFSAALNTYVLQLTNASGKCAMPSFEPDRKRQATARTHMASARTFHRK